MSSSSTAPGSLIGAAHSNGSTGVLRPCYRIHFAFGLPDMQYGNVDWGFRTLLDPRRPHRRKEVDR